MHPRSPLRQSLLGILLGILSGAAFIFAFPPYEIWPLMFIGWIPVLVAQHHIMPPKLSSLPVAIALGLWLQGYLGPIFKPGGTYMIYLPIIVALFALVFDAGKRRFHQNTHYCWFVLEGVLFWGGIEMVRLFIPIAGTMGFIAYPLYRQTWFIQPVSVFGIIGLGMLLMAVNFVLAQGILFILQRRQGRHASANIAPQTVSRSATIVGVMLLLWFALSLILLTDPQERTVTAAAIQPDITTLRERTPEGSHWRDTLYGELIDRTRTAARQGAQFIVWPEGALQFDPLIDDRLGLSDLARETDSYLVVGYGGELTPGVFRNEATLIDPAGHFLGVYGKDHPMLFGGESSPTRGTYPVYETRLGSVSTIICYDLDYTDTTQKMVAQGAQLIGVPSNDWGSIAKIHYTHLVFRAVENQVAMVKADGGYDSAIVAPDGRILAFVSFTEGGGATLVAEVPLGSGNGTLTTHVGDWAGWLGLAGIAFFSLGKPFLVKAAEKTRWRAS